MVLRKVRTPSRSLEFFGRMFIKKCWFCLLPCEHGPDRRFKRGNVQFIFRSRKTHQTSMAIAVRRGRRRSCAAVVAFIFQFLQKNTAEGQQRTGGREGVEKLLELGRRVPAVPPAGI